MQQNAELATSSPQYKSGDVARHRLTGDEVLILKRVEPRDRDRDIDTNWYLVRCGKVDPDAPIAERDYDRKVFCQLELEPRKEVRQSTA